MTNEELRDLYNAGCDGSADAHLEVYVESQRARASEKALAGALWNARQYGDEVGELCWCASPCGPDFVHGRRAGCVEKEAALRLAGCL